MGHLENRVVCELIYYTDITISVLQTPVGITSALTTPTTDWTATVHYRASKYTRIFCRSYSHLAQHISRVSLCLSLSLCLSVSLSVCLSLSLSNDCKRDWIHSNENMYYHLQGDGLLVSNIKFHLAVPDTQGENEINYK